MFSEIAHQKDFCELSLLSFAVCIQSSIGSLMLNFCSISKVISRNGQTIDFGDPP